MVGTTAAAYVRTQAAAAALVNAILNPLIEWFINREKAFQPFAGSDGVIVNMAITSIIVSVLVALFAARGVHHELAAGRLAAYRLAGSARLLLRLPGRAGWLGLLLGSQRPPSCGSCCAASMSLECPGCHSCHC